MIDVRGDKLALFKNKKLINIIFTIIYMFLIVYLGCIKTMRSGDYSICEFVNWYIFKNHKLAEIIIMIALVLLGILYSINKTTQKIAKVGYVLIFVVELLFMILLSKLKYQIYSSYFLILLFTIIWIVYLFIKINVKNENHNYLENIKQAKELYDNNAITKEEYDRIKNNILNNQLNDKQDNETKDNNVKIEYSKNLKDSKIFEIINNPKLLVDITLITTIISMISQFLYSNIGLSGFGNSYQLIFYFHTENLLILIIAYLVLGYVITLYYFYKLKKGKIRNLKKLNNILFINYLIATMYQGLFLITNNFRNVALLYILLTGYLGIIFYNKKIINKQNYILIVTLIVFAIYSLILLFNQYSVVIGLLNVLNIIYIVPMLCYMRLYANNKIEKRG